MKLTVIKAGMLIEWQQWARDAGRRLIRARPFWDHEEHVECYELFHVPV